MAFCISSMEVTADNPYDFSLAKDWCSLFEKSPDLGFFVSEPTGFMLSKQYSDLNVDAEEAREIFLDFARYALENGLRDSVKMHFFISFDNCSEEYQLLYVLKGTAATEQTAFYDTSDFDDNESSRFDTLGIWHDDPDYSEPVILLVPYDR